MKYDIKSFGTGPQTHFLYSVVSSRVEDIEAHSIDLCKGIFESKKEAEAKCDQIGCAEIITYSMDDECYEEYLSMTKRKEPHND